MPIDIPSLLYGLLTGGALGAWLTHKFTFNRDVIRKKDEFRMYLGGLVASTPDFPTFDPNQIGEYRGYDAKILSYHAGLYRHVSFFRRKKFARLCKEMCDCKKDNRLLVLKIKAQELIEFL